MTSEPAVGQRPDTFVRVLSILLFVFVCVCGGVGYTVCFDQPSLAQCAPCLCVVPVHPALAAGCYVFCPAGVEAAASFDLTARPLVVSPLPGGHVGLPVALVSPVSLEQAQVSAGVAMRVHFLLAALFTACFAVTFLSLVLDLSAVIGFYICEFFVWLVRSDVPRFLFNSCFYFCAGIVAGLRSLWRDVHSSFRNVVAFFAVWWLGVVAPVCDVVDALVPLANLGRLVGVSEVERELTVFRAAVRSFVTPFCVVLFILPLIPWPLWVGWVLYRMPSAPEDRGPAVQDVVRALGWAFGLTPRAEYETSAGDRADHSHLNWFVPQGLVAAFSTGGLFVVFASTPDIILLDRVPAIRYAVYAPRSMVEPDWWGDGYVTLLSGSVVALSRVQPTPEQCAVLLGILPRPALPPTLEDGDSDGYETAAGFTPVATTLGAALEMVDIADVGLGVALSTFGVALATARTPREIVIAISAMIASAAIYGGPGGAANLVCVVAIIETSIQTMWETCAVTLEDYFTFSGDEEVEARADGPVRRAFRAVGIARRHAALVAVGALWGPVVLSYLAPHLDLMAKFAFIDDLAATGDDMLAAVKVIPALVRFVVTGDPTVLDALADPGAKLLMRIDRFRAEAGNTWTHDLLVEGIALADEAEVFLRIGSKSGVGLARFNPVHAALVELQHDIGNARVKLDCRPPATVAFFGPPQMGKSTQAGLVVRLAIAAYLRKHPDQVRMAHVGTAKHDDTVFRETEGIVVSDPTRIAVVQNQVEMADALHKLSGGDPCPLNKAALADKGSYAAPRAVAADSNNGAPYNLFSDKVVSDQQSMARRMSTIVVVASAPGTPYKDVLWHVGRFNPQKKATDPGWGAYDQVALFLTLEEMQTRVIGFMVGDMERHDANAKVVAAQQNVFCYEHFALRVACPECQAALTTSAGTQFDVTLQLPSVWDISTTCVVLWCLHAFATSSFFRWCARLAQWWAFVLMVARLAAFAAPEWAGRADTWRVIRFAGLVVGAARVWVAGPRERLAWFVRLSPADKYTELRRQASDALASRAGKFLVALAGVAVAGAIWGAVRTRDRKAPVETAGGVQSLPRFSSRTNTASPRHRGLTLVRRQHDTAEGICRVNNAYVVGPGLIATSDHWQPLVGQPRRATYTLGGRDFPLDGLTELTVTRFPDQDLSYMYDSRCGVMPCDTSTWSEESQPVPPYVWLAFLDPDDGRELEFGPLPTTRVTNIWATDAASKAKYFASEAWSVPFDHPERYTGMCTGLAWGPDDRVYGLICAASAVDGRVVFRRWSRAGYQHMADASTDRGRPLPACPQSEAELVTACGFSRSVTDPSRFDDPPPRSYLARFGAGDRPTMLVLGAYQRGKTNPRGSGRVPHPMRDELGMAFGVDPSSLAPTAGFDGRAVDPVTGVLRRTSVFEQNDRESRAALAMPLSQRLASIPVRRMVDAFVGIVRASPQSSVYPAQISWSDTVRGDGAMIGPTDPGTSSGVFPGMGLKRDLFTMTPEGWAMTPHLQRSAESYEAVMLAGERQPVLCLRQMEKTGEVLTAEKVAAAKTRVVYGGNAAGALGSKKLIGPLMARIASAAELGFMSGINMVSPAVGNLVASLVDPAEAIAQAPPHVCTADEAKMDKHLLGEIVVAIAIVLWELAGDVWPGDYRRRRAAARWPFSVAHSLVIVNEIVGFNIKFMLSGFVFTTILNCIVTWFKTFMVFWLIAGEQGFEEFLRAARAIFGDDQAWRVSLPFRSIMTPEAWAAGSAELGYVTTSDLDKARPPEYVPLMGVATFLKRTFHQLDLGVHGVVLVARLPLKSIVKSLLYPKAGADGAPDPAVFASAADSALRELWLYGPVEYERFAVVVTRAGVAVGARVPYRPWGEWLDDYFAGRLATWSLGI